ncbi:MAG TPA: sigma factor [Mycobacterium sp.]|nr:sigma factor [Mycobacterium sp.]
MTAALPDWDIASDAELAGAAAAGDRAALGGIYDRYADRLHDFCIGMVRDRDAAADCVQEVFCTAAVELRKLREPGKLRPWLCNRAQRGPALYPAAWPGKRLRRTARTALFRRGPGHAGRPHRIGQLDRRSRWRTVRPRP